MSGDVKASPVQELVGRSDLLKMEYINSLPQPFIARFFGGSEWPVYDIDVETGLLRIDVVGLLEVKHIGDVKSFRDAEGTEHDSASFYNEDEPPNAELTRGIEK